LESAITILEEPVRYPSLVNLKADSRLLFNHWLHRTAAVMSPLQGQANPFLTLFVPLALEHDLILHSLLTLSGLHYAEQMSVPVTSSTWSHYDLTVRKLNKELKAIPAEGCADVIPLLIAAL
jgi:hypothetical protein